MLLSLDWLKDFVNIPKKITPAELGLRLTMHTVEIDDVINQADKFKDVVVGKILELNKHPNADKLQLVKVDVGKAKLDVVCGATNIKVGDFVPVALVGAVLPNGLAIKAAEIRGVESKGMLCAEDELGLGDDHSGIMILNKDKLGRKLADHLKMDDIVYEVDNKSITNRPDLWGHLGLAREISAFLGESFKEYKSVKDFKIDGVEEKINIKIEDKKACPRYTAIALDNIEIKESPDWLKARLTAVGLRPINNIVDITNYVMLDIGQPMHAFDADIVKEIVVRRAKSGETMETLDGDVRELDKDMLLIADKNKPIAIAGVMGGANSEIKSTTKTIIFEAANFEPTQIRKTSQKLGLRTESSMRFEKSLDSELCPLAIARAVALVKESCPQTRVISKLYDEKGVNTKESSITLDLDWLYSRIGEKIEEKKVINILESLGFVVEKTENNFNVVVPSWRATKDISIPEDLVEEIVRIYGYNNLNLIMPKVAMVAPEINKERQLERRIKNILSTGAGLPETYSYSFVGAKQLAKLNIKTDNHIKLANPIVSQHTLLRQSLIPNLLDQIKVNQAKYDEFGLFEIGSVYTDKPGEINKDDKEKDKLPQQNKSLGIIMANPGRDEAFARVKGVVEYLLNLLDLEFSFAPAESYPGWAESRTAAKIKIADKEIGLVALADKKISSAIGIKKEVAVVEIDFSGLFDLVSAEKVKKYKGMSKYPPMIRDLAFVVNEKVLYNDIRESIVKASGLIKGVELFDVYQGKELGQGKKNIAFRIIYQDEKKTLTAEEVEDEQKKIIKFLENKFKAQVRNF